MRSTALCHACHPLVGGTGRPGQSPVHTPAASPGGAEGGGEERGLWARVASFPRSAGRPCGDFPVPSLWLPPPGAGGVSVSSREARFPWAALTTATLPFLGSTSCALTEAWPLSEGAASGT